MNSWLSQSIVQSLGWTLLHFLWQGLAIAAVLAVALRLMRGTTAQYRYLAGCAALLLMATAPLVTFHFLAPQPQYLPATLAIPAQSTWIETTTQIATAQPSLVVIAKPEPRVITISERLQMLLPWLVMAWLAGVCALSCRLFAGWLQVRRLRQMATTPLPWTGRLPALAQRLGVHRPVRLLQSALVAVPTVIGWLRPVILLPATCLTGLSPAQLEAIIAHELAHIRRHDYLVNLLQSAVETLLFYHPAVWWVSRRIREEREHCCDDLAVEVCGDRVGYARALATLEELRPASAQLALAAGGAPLLRRIRRLVTPPERSAGRATWPVAGIIVLLVLSVLMAGTREHRAAAQQHDAQSNLKTNDLAVTNEPVSPTNGTTPLEVNIKVKFVATPLKDGKPDLSWLPSGVISNAASSNGANSNASAFTGILTGPQYRAAIQALQRRHGTELLTAPEVTTESGRQAQVQAVYIQQIVTSSGLGFGSDGGTLVASAATSTSNSGTTTLSFGPTLDVTPYISANKSSIRMTLIPSVTEFIGFDNPSLAVPVVDSVSSNGTTTSRLLEPLPASVHPLSHYRLRQLTADVTARDGETVVIGGMTTEVPMSGSNPPQTVKKNLLVFVTATIINPDGTPYHSENEKKALWAQPPPPKDAQLMEETNTIATTQAAPPTINTQTNANPAPSKEQQVATLVQDGKFLYEAGRYNEAEVKLKQALAVDPSNFPASQYLSLIAIKRSDDAKRATFLRLIAERRDQQLDATNYNEHYSSIHVASNGQGRQALIAKLHQIRIDHINYPDLTLPVVLTDLAKISRERDPDGNGINFYFDAQVHIPEISGIRYDTNGNRIPAPPVDQFNITQVKVQLTKSDLSLADALDEIVRSADHPISYSIWDYAVVFSLDPNKTPQFELHNFYFDPDTVNKGLEARMGISLGGTVNGNPEIGFATGRHITPIAVVCSNQNQTEFATAVRAYFGAAGVDFSTNACGLFIFDDLIGRLTVRATARDLDLIETATAVLNTPQPGTTPKAMPGLSNSPSGATPEPPPLEIRTFHVDPDTFVQGLQDALGQSPGIGVVDGAQTVATNGDGTRIFSGNAGAAVVAPLVCAYFRAAGVDFSTNSGKVVIYNDRKGILTVRATARDLDLIEAVVSTLNTPQPQINLQVKLVQITEPVDQSSGSWYLGNFPIAASDTNIPAINTSTNSIFPGVFHWAATNPVARANSTTNAPSASGLQNGLSRAVSATGILTDPQFRATLQALMQNHNANVLTLPGATVESGWRAQLQNLTLQTIVYGGSNGYTTTNMAFGPSLEVVPRISADGFKVEMELTPTITEFLGYAPPVKTSNGYTMGPTGLDHRVNALPLISKRTMNTRVSVWDGETVVLAGFVTDDVVTMTDKVPVLGDIPVMSHLFRSKKSQRVRKMLMIFVTPTIVNRDGTRYHSTEKKQPFSSLPPPPQNETNR